MRRVLRRAELSEAEKKVMRLTLKHVGMEIQYQHSIGMPWVLLKSLKPCDCGKGRPHFLVVTTGACTGFSSEGPWRVRRPGKKTRSVK